MPRAGWVLAWRIATLAAVLGAFRLVAYVVLLAMGELHRAGWEFVLAAALTALAAGVAVHANRRRKALLLEEMPPPGP